MEWSMNRPVSHWSGFDRHAENDHAFLELCGLPVAVANALPGLKEKAALVTQHSAGAGVTELIDSALRGELDGHIRVEASR
jgi:3-deoxy-D-manno-octulosonate 8-phosphate phosphatase KdsC-like HAD superfamily phosphatase